MISLRRGIAVIFAAAAAMLPASQSAAQEGNWEYTGTVYAWVPALGANVATQFGDLDMDVSGRDLLSNLDFAAFAALEARNGRWSLIGDLAYSKVSNHQDTPFGTLFSRAEVRMKLATLSGYAAYRFSETDRAAFDVGGGFRAYDLSLNTTLVAGTQPTQTLPGDDQWVDPLLALRGEWDLSDRWSLTAFGDVGGFGLGSDLSWQVIGTANYIINDRWTLRFGYRHLAFDRPLGGRDTKVELSGPMIGAAFRF